MFLAVESKFSTVVILFHHQCVIQFYIESTLKFKKLFLASSETYSHCLLVGTKFSKAVW